MDKILKCESTQDGYASLRVAVHKLLLYMLAICSHFAYISVRLLSFCQQMCIISPTDGMT